MWEKLKSLLHDDGVFLVLLVLLVGVVSFGLGRHSVAPAPAPAPVLITDAPTPPLLPGAGQENLAVIASRNGTKYHLPSCPGASQIKVANQIQFSSRAAAEAAGYTPAANCPGL